MASAIPADDGIAGYPSVRSGNSFTLFKPFDGISKTAEAGWGRMRSRRPEPDYRLANGDGPQ